MVVVKHVRNKEPLGVQFPKGHVSGAGGKLQMRVYDIT